MSTIQSRNRYSGTTIALHWLMLVLIASAYVLILSRTEFEKGSDARNLVKMLHFSVGVTIFALVWLRIAARLSGGPAPAITPAPGPMQHKAAKLAHLALYGLMIGMPIGGMAILAFEGHAIPYFGLFEFRLPLAENKDLAEVFEELHETGGTVGYFLIGLHAAASLYHHYVRRDDTVKRMLPGG
jgi:cytochrome b561